MAGLVVASIIAIVIAGIFMGWLVLEVAVGIHREDGRGSLVGIAPGRASRTARRCTGAFARMP